MCDERARDERLVKGTRFGCGIDINNEPMTGWLEY